MIDENDTNSTAEIAATDTPIAPKVKKTRAPRKLKTAAEVVPASSATAVKSTRSYRKKVSGQPIEAKPATVDTAISKNLKKVGGKSVGASKSAAKVQQSSTGTSTAIEEMADLLQLEEENKKLRKVLSEKLRAENSDLRKRLGLD